MKYLIISAIALSTSIAPIQAANFVVSSAFDIFTPSTRGDATSTYVGWDSFDDGGAGNEIINDSTPDLGSSVGAFVTLNAEDHLSGSGNFYSGGGSVNERIAFDTAGIVGSGFTSVIAQGITLFGPLGSDVGFSEIHGVAPEVIQLTNGAGKGQLWAKWDLPGHETSYEFTMTGGGNVSLDKLTIDTSWSASRFNTDSASAIPEPSSALLSLVGLSLFLGNRRRTRWPD